MGHGHVVRPVQRQDHRSRCDIFRDHGRFPVRLMHSTESGRSVESRARDIDEAWTR